METPPRSPHGGRAVGVSTCLRVPAWGRAHCGTCRGDSQRTSRPAPTDIGNSWTWPFLAHRRVWPTSAHAQGSAARSGCPAARPVGRPLPTPLAQLATLAKEPGLEAGTFGCSLGHFLPPCPSAAQHSVLRTGSGWGGCYECHRRRHTFCLCFKESDVPFVNIQEKY